MNRVSAYTQDLSECRDASQVGGKAASLGRLVRAGFPVPGGFVINTRAFERARGRSFAVGVPGGLPDEVAEEIRLGYRAMGGGAVAVRSSATAEDTPTASMAGQYETFLNVEGEAEVLKAVRECWASLDTPRVRAYLCEQGIDPVHVSMAIIVQRLIPADAAGVLFTANPHGDGRREMLVEASWGLGESVVSGRVQPDVLRLEYESGRVLAATISDKQVYLSAGGRGEQPVDEARRKTACLSGRDIQRLWRLGRRLAEHLGSPQDMEWAIHGGELYLLQARPITTLRAAEGDEAVLMAVRQRLNNELSAGRGPWVLHNLAETLPHPTPLTWSVIRRFMSGSGGFGAMYRQAGFRPSPVVDREGFLELIAGRVYMDVSRAPEMFFEGFPFAYDLEVLRRSPDASQTPPTLPRGSFSSRMVARRRLAAVQRNLHALSADFDRRLCRNLCPRLACYVDLAKQIDLRLVSADRLIGLWQEHERQVLDTFGPHSLMPSLICEMAMAELREFLQECFWEEDADDLAGFISAGGALNRTLTTDVELYEVGKGSRPLERWMADHGHRAVGEFDLAAPRRREQPAAVSDLAARLAAGVGPLDRHDRTVGEVGCRVESLRARLSGRDRREFDRRLDLVRRYMAFREDSKDFLMLGYDLLRDLALEAGRRLNVGEEVFYLTREELFDGLRAGSAPRQVIDQRKADYEAEIRIDLPRVIEGAMIEVLGETGVEEAHTGSYQALGISSGEAVGPARILQSPAERSDLGRGYVLVCPSTDPSWTPLFVNAAGLVLERGGTLSHGAVVAREMGLPAVVLPDAARLFAEGEVLRVDGRRGRVVREGEAPCGVSASATCDVLGGSGGADRGLPGPDDVCVSRDAVPPPFGRKDRRAARMRNVLALAWTVFLLGFFLLPESWVHQPSLAAMDWVLWPIVRFLGKPGVVVVVAVGLALLTLLIQKYLTDNRRLLEAKRRAAVLRIQADGLPEGSPRRRTLTRLAAGVQYRTLMAALVPVGVLLGPMVMPFVWFKDRVDPAAGNAPAGSPVQVVALVDGDWLDPVRIETPPAIQVDDSTPSTRMLPPLRKTLERLLSLYRQPQEESREAWELKVGPDLTREQAAKDLQAYLEAGLPPRGMTWIIRPPADLDGRFPVTVATGGHRPVTIQAVVGDRCAPAPSLVTGDRGSPVRELRVVYPRPKQAPCFWRPFAAFGSLSPDAAVAGEGSRPVVGRLAAVDVGWLWLYIIVYLPTLLTARAVMKVA
ncbi:MAG TPA: PEP/pyruvate-binding domain-containing protein [Phycisphaerae bacterium]|nr:PEP/pyruvate-binding domain-containing protein [Phycisphaerae bacterium]HRY69193.1 PEP/pyruvate-binding domain-containing protein [Phycisphaerae bacterium]HSA26154.1 PEP/pyruvate-binding domain-containing protein [Phycisphaerae bacterium]